jgi:hypothetical protein
LEFTSVVSQNTDDVSTEYEPVTLVNEDYSQSNQNVASIFNPDISVLVDEQVTYNNVTVQISNQETLYT